MKIEADLKKQGQEFGTNHPLTRLPSAFKTAEGEDIQLMLKLKMFTVSLPFDEEKALSTGFVDNVVEYSKTVLPLMQLVWRAVDPLREGG